MRKIIGLGCLGLLLTGCSSLSNNGSFWSGNSEPQLAVNHTLGTINHGIYSSPIGQTKTSFSIEIPQASDAIDYPYTQIQDFRGNDFTTVIFGPGFTNKNVYRVKVLGLVNNSSFNAQATQVLAQTLSKMENLYGVKPLTLLQEPIVPHGHAGTFGVYQQDLKDGGEILTQSVYIIKDKHYLTEFWITASNLSKRDGVGDMNRIDVVKRIWEPADRFLDSFQLSSQRNSD